MKMHAGRAVVHREVQWAGLSGGGGSAMVGLRMNKTGCVLLAVFLALCASLFFNVLLLGLLGAGEAESLAVRRFSPRLQEVVVEPGVRGAGKIAVIPLQGIIYTDTTNEWGTSMVDDVKEALRLALEDDEVKAVVLAVNSPGGEVTASDILYHEVVKFQKKKPVVAAMGSVAASGAYYVACAADFIMANETTFTGSIGVIIQSLNYEGLFDKVGLDALVFKSGKFKDMLSGSRPVTPEEKDYVQGMVMQVYDRFLGIVAFSRALPAEVLRERVADGRILTGKDAKEAGLVDGLGYLEDAYDKARALANAPDAGVMRYQSGLNLQRLLRWLGAGSEAKMEVQLTPGPRFRLQPGLAYYLPEFYAW